MSDQQVDLAVGAPGRAESWLGAALAVDAACADRAMVDLAMVGISRLIAVLESQRTVCYSVLRRLTVVPSVDLAAGSGMDQRDANTVIERAKTADEVPAFGAAFADGTIAGQHVDRLGGTLRRLPPPLRGRLLEHVDELVQVAQDGTPGDFSRHLQRLERELQADDGVAILARQKSQVRLRTFVAEDGMHQWRLALDPETAVWATSRLNAATDQLRTAGQLPEGAPVDPRERYSFLAAHALLALVLGESGVAAGRPEYIIIEDRRTPFGVQPVLDTGQPGQLPASTIAAMRDRSRQITITVDGDSIISAPGQSNLGRGARLASHAQRRMLRALYATCAVPRCPVRFDQCTIHHVDWWENGGLTNLDRLLPLCWQHHENTHRHGWLLDLRANHQLTITLPSGAQVHGGPNRVQATRAQATVRQATMRQSTTHQGARHSRTSLEREDPG